MQSGGHVLVQLHCRVSHVCAASHFTHTHSRSRAHSEWPTTHCIGGVYKYIFTKGGGGDNRGPRNGWEPYNAFIYSYSRFSTLLRFKCALFSRSDSLPFITNNQWINGKNNRNEKKLTSYFVLLIIKFLTFHPPS